jgi:hypothetical protein
MEILSTPSGVTPVAECRSTAPLPKKAPCIPAHKCAGSHHLYRRIRFTKYSTSDKMILSTMDVISGK